ncbi:Nose resistant to fluoxetine protein 6 [Portunus trituberculatus]|uniref:Nose resistant to fluoxetine protein 6 n=1 Tax=Portunus trituberculatus TaxID=210409 RepID=A0A5B7DEW0_PORTR|nr:Nose resistant to fluoxetine protein 6 [Portunus trituberculatus]
MNATWYLNKVNINVGRHTMYNDCVSALLTRVHEAHEAFTQQGGIKVGIRARSMVRGLVPPIGLTVGLYATVMRFVVTGPIQSVWSSFFYPTCQQYWWRDVFFLDNFYFDSAVCVGQAWYLGADMQLYLVAPLIILPLYFTKSFGKAWLFLVTALSAIVPAAIIYHYDLPPTYVNNPLVMPEKTDGYTNKIYPMPWTRASPWLAGVWLGYIFYKQGNTKYKMNAVSGWTVATITGLLVVFGMFSYNRVVVPMPYEVMTQVVYGGGHRLAWGAVLAWVVFACHNGYGEINPAWSKTNDCDYFQLDGSATPHHPHTITFVPILLSRLTTFTSPFSEFVSQFDYFFVLSLLYRLLTEYGDAPPEEVGELGPAAQDQVLCLHVGS